VKERRKERCFLFVVSFSCLFCLVEEERKEENKQTNKQTIGPRGLIVTYSRKEKEKKTQAGPRRKNLKINEQK